MIDEYRARLQRAITALGDLIGEEGSINGGWTDEMYRLKAKREGVELALSYYEEEKTVRESDYANGHTYDRT